MADAERFSLFRRYVPLIVWCLVLGTILLIPLRIIGYGYRPGDDALRHAAKAVSGKPWREILVMRQEITTDQSAGWHVILGVLHRLLGWNPDTLVAFSVAGLFLLVAASALPWIRPPEAWLASLLVMNLATMQLMFRLTLGRPLVLSISVLIIILLAWTEHKTDRISPFLLAGTTLLIAFSVWVHGSWYLFLLPVGAFFLAGRWRAGLRLGGCWILGSAVGSTVTGHPIQFLWEHLLMMQGTFGHHTLQRMLVSEFQPSGGGYAVVIIIMAVLLWKKVRGQGGTRIFNDPIFLVAILGWLLGLKVQRFWLDWGWPAAIVWMAREFQHALAVHQNSFSLKRLAVTVFICVALFLSTTSDYYGRWTNNLAAEYLTPDQPELAGWLPGKEGIIYSDNMQVFYQTFFRNPHASWRYILGYEPSLMPASDLATYRQIQWSNYDPRAYRPWVAKMRPQDRLILSRAAGKRPEIPELEWNYVARNTWIGRIPREGAAKK